MGVISAVEWVPVESGLFSSAAYRASVRQLVTGMNGLVAVTHAVPKTLFLDIVKVLTNAGFSATFDIPSKIEGLTFGKDVRRKNTTYHTLWVANDNDFVLTTADKPPVGNSNQFFVFGFTDADLGGSKFVAQFPDLDDENNQGNGNNQDDEN